MQVRYDSEADAIFLLLRALRILADERPEVRRIMVSLDPRPRRTDDGIDIIPATDFARRLWQGDLAEDTLKDGCNNAYEPVGLTLETTVRRLSFVSRPAVDPLPP